MRNTLSTAYRLSDCEHSDPVEIRLFDGAEGLRCTQCGAWGEPAPEGAGTAGSDPAWKRPNLVERLERDLGEEVPVMLYELEDAEMACDEIVRSLEEIRSLARRPDFEIDAEAITGVLDAARGWRSAVERLRDGLERGKRQV